MKFIQSPNYWKGRGGMKITAIVVHITDSSFGSAYNTFMNPESYVSAHYLMDDEIIQMVSEEDTAWHAGIIVAPTWKGFKYSYLNEYHLGGYNLSEYSGSDRGEQGNIIQPVWEKKLGGFSQIINPNFYTLGVEFAIKDGVFPNVVKWRKWAKFIKELAEKHNLPMDSLHIVNHRAIRSNKTCPGMWFTSFWAQFLNKIYK